MANALKAGLNMVQSLELASQEAGGTVREELAAAVSDIRLGRSLDDALSLLAGRVPLPDVEMFAEAVHVLRETGGNIAETFETMVVTIRERRLVRDRIRSLTSQTLFQGVVISLIPAVLCAVFLIAAPDFIMPLFTTIKGLLLLAVALLLLLAGGCIMKRISKVDI